MEKLLFETHVILILALMRLMVSVGLIKSSAFVVSLKVNLNWYNYFLSVFVTNDNRITV